MIDVNIFKIQYMDINIKKSEARLFRGYFGNKFKDIDQMHNHIDEKQVIYRYPLIQYKVIDRNPFLLGIESGADILKDRQIFLEDEMIIGNKKLISNEQKIESEKYLFGESDNIIKYKFVTPWMCLNQSNISKYNKLDDIEKEDFLKRMLIGNILSLSKGLKYTVEKEIKVRLNVKEEVLHFKGNKMAGFIGEFYVNFEIPDYMALGKGISRGFGTIQKVK